MNLTRRQRIMHWVSAHVVSTILSVVLSSIGYGQTYCRDDASQRECCAQWVYSQTGADGKVTFSLPEASYATAKRQSSYHEQIRKRLCSYFKGNDCLEVYGEPQCAPLLASHRVAAPVSIDSPRSLQTKADAEVFLRSTRVADVSAISLAMYDPSNKSVRGYTKISTLPTRAEFYSAIYKSDEGKRIIVAFRGTDIGGANQTSNLLADAQFINRVSGDRLRSYVETATSTLRNSLGIFKPSDGYSYTITGHSLAGGIANIIGHASGIDTISFNAPGVGSGALENMADITWPLVSQRTKDDHLDQNIVTIRVMGDDLVSGLPLVKVGKLIEIEPPFFVDPTTAHKQTTIDSFLRAGPKVSTFRP